MKFFDVWFIATFWPLKAKINEKIIRIWPSLWYLFEVSELDVISFQILKSYFCKRYQGLYFSLELFGPLAFSGFGHQGGSAVLSANFTLYRRLLGALKIGGLVSRADQSQRRREDQRDALRSNNPRSANRREPAELLRSKQSWDSTF